MVTAINTAAFTGEYRTEFSITGPEQKESPLFERVCDLVRERFEGLQGDEELAHESGAFEELAYQGFQIELPHGRNPDFHLRLDVKLSTEGGPVALKVQSAFMDTDGPPLPPELVAGPPRLVLDLFKVFECYNGPDRLSAIPVRLAPENAEDFASRIFNPDRRLPILAVSENWRRQTPANPNWLQQLLAGVAEVVTYGSDTADELRGHVGFQLACFNGAMRIYQPGCSRDDRREQHKFWMPSDAGTLLRRPAGRVVQELVRYLPESIDAREFENIRGQTQQRRMAELAAERLAFPLRQRIGELESEIDSLRQELQERERDTTTRLAELHNLHQQLIDRDLELDTLRNELEQAIRREAEYGPEIAHLHRQQAERDERIESLRQQLEAAISQADSGQSEVVQLHSQLLERDSQINSLWDELDKAVGKESKSEQEIAQLHVQIQDADAQVESLRKRLEDAAGQEGVSQATIAQLKASLQERDDELGILRAHLEDARNRSEEIGNLISELNKELGIRDTNITNLRLLLEGVEEGSADSDRVIAELRHELRDREEDAKAISELLEKARNRADAAENAAGELRRELERHLAESHAIVNIIQEYKSDLAGARSEITNARDTIAEQYKKIDGLNQELQEMQQKLLNHEVAIDDMESELKAKDGEIRYLKYLLDTRQLPEPSEPIYDEELPLHFQSVGDAVIVADQNFRDVLQFLESAFDSAEDYPFQYPTEVYQAFSLLQQLAVARGQGPLGISVGDWMKGQGCDYAAHESEPTMQQFGSYRRFWDKRRSQYLEMQEHIKFGSHTADKQHYIRIHFCWEAESAQYIIGHVGEHLPTVSG